MSHRADGVTLAVFLAAVVIGGANFVAVKATVDELDPLFGAAVRFGLAGALFLAILAVARTPFPRGAALVGATVYGALSFGAAYALMYFALVGLSAGVASVLMATTPLFTLLFAVLLSLERLTVRGIAGAALAIAGVALLSLSSLDGDVPFRYFLAAFVTPVIVAASTIVVKRFPRTDPIATNAVGMVVGAAMLAAASLAAGEAWTTPDEGATWAATAWLVVAGSVGLFWCFLFVVQRWTASASTYALPLMPVVAVALGALLLDERLGVAELAGGLLVIAGAYYGAIRGAAVTEPAGLPEAAPAAERA